MQKLKSKKKSPNAELAAMLVEIANYERVINRQPFKFDAYKKAAKAIESYSKKITSAEEAMKLPGIGPRIGEKIEEYLKTGHILKFDQIKSEDSNEVIQKLTTVSGIGPAAAQKFYNEGVRSVSDLMSRIHELTPHQRIGIKYYNELLVKIPRSEMEEIERFVKMEIDSVDPEFVVEIVGSYRRGEMESGDVDVLLMHPRFPSYDTSPAGLLRSVINRLEECQFLTDKLACGETKYMGVCVCPGGLLHRRIDIRLFPADQYYCAIVHSTGSAMFNKKLRSKALECGYTLNEYSIRRVGTTGAPGEPLPVSSEKEIFDYIGMEYVPPEERSIE